MIELFCSNPTNVAEIIKNNTKKREKKLKPNNLENSLEETNKL